MSKTSRNKPMITEWSLIAMHQAKNFVSIVNTSGQSRIKSSKSNFSGRSEYYIQLGSKYISSSYIKSGKSTICFIYHCWSRTTQERSGWTSLYLSLKWATTKNMKWKPSKTAQFTLRKQTDTSWGYTIWLYKKITWKKKIAKNHPQQSCIFRK